MAMTHKLASRTLWFLFLIHVMSDYFLQVGKITESPWVYLNLGLMSIWITGKYVAAKNGGKL